MSINRGMDKEDVVRVYTGILLSHKKEWNWVICRDVDGPRECHTEWSKSEREKQVSYINAYMWNLEKWYRWSYLQSRNRDTDVENKCMDTKGGRGRWEELGDWDWHIIMSFRSRIRRSRVMMVQNMPTTSTTLIENFIFLPTKLFYIFAFGHGIMPAEPVLISFLARCPALHFRIWLYWVFNVLSFGVSAISLTVEDMLLSTSCSIQTWGHVWLAPP